MQNIELEMKNISYTIDNKDILNNITFKVEYGDILAILGENGAGKTTLFEILLGIIRPSQGTIRFNGLKDISLIKDSIGVLWDNIKIFPLLRVKEVFHYVSIIYKIPKPIKKYKLLGLQSIEDKFLQELSHGERKKVEILISTMHEPGILILDEPTSTIDPLIQSRIWENIFLEKRRTIIFSTHQWEEAVKYSTKIIFIHKGEILNSPASCEEILNTYKFTSKIVIPKNMDLQIPKQISSLETKNNTIFLLTEEDSDFILSIKQQVMNFSILPIELKDIYCHLTNKKR